MSESPKRKAGGQPGNNNNVKNKPWADALRRALKQFEDEDRQIGRGDALRAIADGVIREALDGNSHAIREIGDRMDGKAHQSISGPDDQPIELGIRVTFGRD